ncbi:23S rRNA pseudouridine(1911/1915/1917) synthase RluD [Aliidiomarina haloalkalitolerans]|uniref:Pseudouridine synthase n=1 Tax=Aliidiomarina haloalkalitolerans TaxID=859059 RepID=A0A432VTW8_9GAMM|nr:23S rRNA pseudouridine(1911/1915/1917) synthase RluD [Aliidiomarina haloalkalitolerans]MCL4409487.1 23S rRNA pseudouridine(1911/1915/1917) synthase RluD [Gammaproteobacteria bacterium]RUO19917.1 23S rRNA pseudouridine(1911/1915/1917) synthase RluD [Aliidiomarina haloalkalitolerans]
MTDIVKQSAIIPEQLLGSRLDSALAELFPDFSRSRLKTWIQDGNVTVNGSVVTKPREKVIPGQQIDLNAVLEAEVFSEPQAIDLDIVYEDDDLLVINKPAGLVVHPGAGTPDGTLLNALLHHCPQVEQLPRAGIVHRLDKDTTGLMVVAKNIATYTALVAALQARDITREYEAVAIGVMTAGGSVDAPIGRHPTKRTHMAVNPNGKPALTHYRVAERFRAHTRLRLRLESGRTHQIRVHMAHLGYPLVGDPQYGGRPRPPKQASEQFMQIIRGFNRQALHAIRLALVHPRTGEMMEWTAPIPEDMQQLIAVLRSDLKEHGE